ncbi:hypothetical protein OEA41_002554 [Lepraria neglecta]|uniref:Amino acid permease/ SLC12A domain-containing protein n=1 Tax=Lepraria neglecta TaxID=209136 RepID=A0AAE0DMJ3_9LECA|nr:hypothetical protein OEA41_002554 [Lepraria neglecta]
MEGISEMIQMFPTPNALMEFVRAFVDPDLAWVVGVAYWYTYSSIFAAQIIAAASFAEYWGLAQVYQTVAFYVLCPVVILFINFAGVFVINHGLGGLKLWTNSLQYFGWIETVGGILKICMVIGGAIFMYVIHGQEHNGSEYINDGFRHNTHFADNAQVAGCYVVPIIAYGFLGVEMISITAFEARDLRSLRIPSQTIAYFVVSIYFLLAIGEFLNVEWVNSALPPIYGGINEDSVKTVGMPSRSKAVFVIAAVQAGYKNIPGLLNGFMILSALSASNSALYIASRSMYGMTRTINPWRWFSSLKMLGSVWHKTGVPMETIAQLYPEYNRWRGTGQASTFLAGLQPAIAWFGLIACLIIVFVFTTATWWNTPADFKKVAVAYGAPVVLTVFFLILKVITRRPPVRLDNDFSVLASTLEHLKFLKPERQRGPQTDDGQEISRRLRGIMPWKSRSRSGHSPSSAENELRDV